MSKRKYFRKTAWLVSVSFIFCMVITLSVADTASAERQFIRFGGSNPGGSWFTIAGGITALFNREIPNFNASPVATGGSVDCNRQARKHNLDTWLSHSLHAYDNWSGTGIFEGKGPFHGFRFVAGVYESWHHFVTLEKNPIYKIEDLKGKKVAVGSAGSGAAANSENILRVLGIWEHLTPMHLTFGASGRALTDGHADALGMSSAPMPAVVTVEAMHKIRLLELTDAQLDKCIAKYPAYKKAVMPAGTYKSWTKPYNAIGFQVYWMAHEKTDPEAVYMMLKTAFSEKNKKFLAKVHKNLKNLSLPLEGMEQMGIPMHAGAVKYFNEQGISIPANLIVD